MMGYLMIDTGMNYANTATNMLNLSQTRSFNITINGISNVTTGDGDDDYTFIIPIISNVPSIMMYEPAVNFEQSMLIERPTQSLQISVYDDNHNLCQMSSDFYMILESVSY